MVSRNAGWRSFCANNCSTVSRNNAVPSDDRRQSGSICRSVSSRGSIRRSFTSVLASRLGNGSTSLIAYSSLWIGMVSACLSTATICSNENRLFLATNPSLFQRTVRRRTHAQRGSGLRTQIKRSRQRSDRSAWSTCSPFLSASAMRQRTLDSMTTSDQTSASDQGREFASCDRRSRLFPAVEAP